MPGLQTVAPSTATSIAKPLKSQSVDKNKIWLLFAAGGAGLLGTAILLEQNEKLFPAIARANKAMRAAQQMKEVWPVIAAATAIFICRPLPCCTQPTRRDSKKYLSKRMPLNMSRHGPASCLWLSRIVGT